jgi:hypothetical protein
MNNSLISKKIVAIPKMEAGIKYRPASFHAEIIEN